MKLTARERGLKQALAYGRCKALLEVLQSGKGPFDTLRGLLEILNRMRIFGSRVNAYSYFTRTDLLEKEWIMSLPKNQLPTMLGINDKIDELVEALLKETDNVKG